MKGKLIQKSGQTHKNATSHAHGVEWRWGRRFKWAGFTECKKLNKAPLWFWVGFFLANECSLTNTEFCRQTGQIVAMEAAVQLWRTTRKARVGCRKCLALICKLLLPWPYSGKSFPSVYWDHSCTFGICKDSWKLRQENHLFHSNRFLPWVITKKEFFTATLFETSKNGSITPPSSFLITSKAKYELIMYVTWMASSSTCLSLRCRRYAGWGKGNGVRASVKCRCQHFW